MSSSSSVRNKKKKGNKQEKGKKVIIPETIPTDLKKKILEYSGARRFDNNTVEFTLDYDETKVFSKETTDFMITIHAVINFNADVEDQYINFVYNNLRRRFGRDPFTQHEIGNFGTRLRYSFTTKNNRTIGFSFYFSQNIAEYISQNIARWFSDEVYTEGIDEPEFDHDDLKRVLALICEEAARLSAQGLEVLSQTSETQRFWTKTMDSQPSYEDIIEAMMEVWEHEERRGENVIIEFALINRPQNIEVDGQQVTIRGLLKF